MKHVFVLQNAPRLGELSGEEKTLTQLGVTRAGMRIHVRDLSGKIDMFSDEALDTIVKFPLVSRTAVRRSLTLVR